MFSKFAIMWSPLRPYPELILIDEVYGGRDRVVFIDRDYRASYCWIVPSMVQAMLPWIDVDVVAVGMGDRGVFIVRLMCDNDNAMLQELFDARLNTDCQEAVADAADWLDAEDLLDICEAMVGVRAAIAMKRDRS